MTHTPKHSLLIDICLSSMIVCFSLKYWDSSSQLPTDEALKLRVCSSHHPERTSSLNVGIVGDRWRWFTSLNVESPSHLVLWRSTAVDQYFQLDSDHDLASFSSHGCSSDPSHLVSRSTPCVTLIRSCCSFSPSYSISSPKSCVQEKQKIELNSLDGSSKSIRPSPWTRV